MKVSGGACWGVRLDGGESQGDDAARVFCLSRGLGRVIVALDLLFSSRA